MNALAWVLLLIVVVLVGYIGQLLDERDEGRGVDHE
jgi:hypothetical protein